MEDAQYKKYYVAFLDILGFKNLINNPETTCQSILKMYKEFGVMHKTFFNGKRQDIQEVTMKVMSDSICLFIEADKPNAFYSLILFCTAFQCDLLMLPQPIFVRGGIALGDMFVENDIIFGSALTQAYLLEEKNAKVPRIIILKETLEYGKKQGDADGAKDLDILTFRDDDAFYTLNYLYFLYLEGNNEIKDKIKDVISGYLDTKVDESIRQKYLYIDKNIRQIEEIMSKLPKENNNA